jgi:hypothetical protein
MPASQYCGVVCLRALLLYLGPFFERATRPRTHQRAGLVPSSPMLAFMQWAGRSNVLYLVCQAILQVRAWWRWVQKVHVVIVVDKREGQWLLSLAMMTTPRQQVVADPQGLKKTFC